MVVSKRGSPSCVLHSGDIKIKQMEKYNYLVSWISKKRKVWHRNPKMHCNREICLSETNQNIKRLENVLKPKEEWKAMWQWMLDYILIDEEQAWSEKKWGSTDEYWECYGQNMWIMRITGTVSLSCCSQSEVAEISQTHNTERRYWKFIIRRILKARETTSNFL